eukprot:5272621-Amphidinium_carterae.1
MFVAMVFYYWMHLRLVVLVLELQMERSALSMQSLGKSIQHSLRWNHKMQTSAGRGRGAASIGGLKSLTDMPVDRQNRSLLNIMLVHWQLLGQSSRRSLGGCEANRRSAQL